MEQLNFISHLEDKLRAGISLTSHESSTGYWHMRVQLYYENKPAGVASFTLQGYSREEAEDVARNLGKNAYLMREIDEFLWGESD